MKCIPHEDNWEREYLDNLKSQRKKRKAKKLKQIIKGMIFSINSR